MAQYLRKYIGTYRVFAEYDLSTNDFVRNPDTGLIDNNFDDLYLLSKKNNIKIFHDYRNNLLCYIPSLKKGNRLVKQIQSEYPDLIFDIIDTSEEVTFKFKANNLEKIVKFIPLKTNGANISPFSVKNLPKEHYQIPSQDLAQYKNIIKDSSKDEYFIIKQGNRDFDSVIVEKSTYMSSLNDLKSDKRKKKLKGKEYIHSIGLWKEYIDFLNNYIQTIKNKY